jgi:hypothetical protein
VMKFRVDFSRNFSSHLITSKLNLWHCTTGTPGSGVEHFNSEFCVLKYWLLSIKYGYLWLQKFAHRLLSRNFESVPKSPVSGPAMYENLRVGRIILGHQICPNAEAMVKCEGARILAMESCDWGKICTPAVRIGFKAKAQLKWIDTDPVSTLTSELTITDRQIRELYPVKSYSSTRPNFHVHTKRRPV